MGAHVVSAMKSRFEEFSEFCEFSGQVRSYRKPSQFDFTKLCPCGCHGVAEVLGRQVCALINSNAIVAYCAESEEGAESTAGFSQEVSAPNRNLEGRIKG